MLSRVITALIKFITCGAPELLMVLLWVLLAGERKARNGELARLRKQEQAHQKKYFNVEKV